MTAKAGQIIIDIATNSASFKKGLDEAKNHTESFVAEMKEKAMHLAEAFALFEVAESFKKVFEGMETIVLTSQKMGIPIEQLSRMQLAADVTHTSIESLAGGVEKFSKNLEAVAGGQGGKAALALQAIGVSATDAHGKLKPTEDLLLDVADKFGKTSDGANKTAVAIALFGKAGAELIPYFNKGRDGLKELNDIAEKLGLTISEKTGVQIEEFSKDITILHDASAGLMRQVISQLLPALSELTDWMVAAKLKGDLANTMFKVMSSVLANLAEVALQVREAFYEVNVIWNAMKGDMEGDHTWSGSMTRWKAAFADISTQAQKTKEEVAHLYETLDANKQHSNDAEKGNGFGSEDKKPQMKGFTELGIKATKDHKDAIKELIEKLQIQNEEFSKGALQMKIDEELHKAGSKATAEQRAEISKLVIEHAKLEAARASDQEKMKAYADQISKTTDLLKGQFESMFSSAISGTLSLSQAIGDLAKKLAEAGFSNILTNLMNSIGGHPIYGGGGASNFLSGLGNLLFGGARAEGGSVSAGTTYLVGEKGPELFTAGSPGSITPNHALGGGQTTHINIDARGADPGQIALLRQQLVGMQSNFGAMVKSVVNSERRDNLAFAR